MRNQVVSLGATPMFGKRIPGTMKAQNAAARAIPHARPVPQHIIPQELFEPESPVGAFLSEIGMAANDDTNIMPTDSALQAKLDAGSRETDARAAEVNRSLPNGCHVKPHYLIPAQVWKGPHADFLLHRLDMIPDAPWNVLLLPADAQSAELLDMHEHPGILPCEYLRSAENMIAAIARELDAAHRLTSADLQRRNIGSLTAFTKALDTAQESVRGVGFHLASVLIGENTLNRSRQRFHGETFAGSQH
jgi:hypothetical protein